jgi:hypothetical protein
MAYMVLAGLIGAWLVWDAAAYRLVTYSMWADYWEHSAALKQWLANLVDPGNPHLESSGSSARYIPPYFLLALLGSVLGLDAIELMAISAVVNYILVAVGLYLFAMIYFRNPWAPVTAFVVLFACWGVPWIWSNLYELRSFFMTAAYPSTFVLGLSLISFWLTLSFMRGRVGFFMGLLGLLVLSAVMFLSHALTGVFAIAGCCLLALTDEDTPLGLRSLVTAVMLGGTLLAVVWPWFSVWDVILASSNSVDDRTWQNFGGFDAMLQRARSGAWMHMFFYPRQFVVALGPALIGAPLLFWLLLRRRWLFIPAGAVVMAAPLVINVFYQVALAHRFMLYLVFFLHLAIVWAVLELFDRRRAARLAHERHAGIGAAVRAVQALAIGCVILHVGLLVGDYQGRHLKHTLELVDKRAALPPGYDVPRLYRELTENLPDTAVVIGDARLTWPVPTFRGKVVALPENHENSLVLDQFERADAVLRFIAPGTDAVERQAIAERYGATHALVDVREANAELLAWLSTRGVPVASVERYRMVQLR